MAQILYIEDDFDSMLLARCAFEARGHKVVPAFNGLEGLDLAMAHPSLILLDIQLPDISGYEVARRLRASGHTDLAYVPIIALTAHGKKEEIEKALEAGCDECISKPVGMRELVARVEAYLSTDSSDDDVILE